MLHEMLVDLADYVKFSKVNNQKFLRHSLEKRKSFQSLIEEKLT